MIIFDTDEIKYIIIKANLVNKLDFSKLLSSEEALRYNTNKNFLQSKKTFIKFKGEPPEELK